MRWIVNLLKAILALVVLLAGVGLLLPARQQVERSIELAATPQQVWPWLAEPKRWESWSPWFAKDPAMQLTYSGAASGAGAGWSWVSESQGRGSMRFEQAEPPTRLAFRLNFDDMGSSATGSFELQPQGAGSKLTWRLDSDAGWNPVARWFGLVLDRMVGPDFEFGLGRLAQQVKAGAGTP